MNISGTEFLERRYNPDLEKQAVVNRYRISYNDCEDLLTLFRSQCLSKNSNSNTTITSTSSSSSMYPSSSRVVGMKIEEWLQWLCGGKDGNGCDVKISYISRPLAEAVFVSKLTGTKNEWRFFDFADFAISFGTAPIEV